MASHFSSNNIWQLTPINGHVELGINSSFQILYNCDDMVLGDIYNGKRQLRAVQPVPDGNCVKLGSRPAVFKYNVQFRVLLG